MIKIFGRQPLFFFHHIVYEYDLQDKTAESKLACEKIVNDFARIDIGYFSMPMLEKVLRKNPDNSECYMFLSGDRQRIVGFALISYKGAKEIHYRIKNADAFITALGIFRSERGKGYSQELLKCVANICHSKGMKCLRLAVDSDNVTAIRAYEKFGFIKYREKKFIRIAGIDFLVNKNL